MVRKYRRYTKSMESYINTLRNMNDTLKTMDDDAIVVLSLTSKIDSLLKYKEEPSKKEGSL